MMFLMFVSLNKFIDGAVHAAMRIVETILKLFL